MRASPLISTLAAIGASLIVIDGDTIRSDQERIRLEGIDAAEIGHAKCEAERRLAVLSKHRLQELLGSGSVDIRRNDHPDPPDRYGRTLAQVLVDGEDVACVLIKEGYARPWRGRREDWCKSLDRQKVAEAALSCSVTY
jgi:endonuclease YncB( thermonuclease family)